MTDYTKLVDALRYCGNFTEREGCDESCEYFNDMDCPNRIMSDAAAAIEDLQAEIRESMQTCAECGDEQEQKVKELQARLGEAENSAERWKDMYLTKHEPKRGEWKTIRLNNGGSYTGCSCCEAPIPTDTMLDYIPESESKYCYSCGAKMIGEQNVE